MWGIDFLGPFSSSFGNKYILVAVDYVSKWAEASSLTTNDAKCVLKFFLKIIFLPDLIHLELSFFMVALIFVINNLIPYFLNMV